MLVLALHFSRDAPCDVEDRERRLRNGSADQCLPHVEAAERELMPVAEGNSLKTEEKTRSAGQHMIKR